MIESNHLTAFNGLTGAVMSTVAFQPARGNICDWGDCKGNRGDRFLSGTAYLDGQRPSIIIGRGYYNKSTLAALGFRNGQLTMRWKFDSSNVGSQWGGRGAHSLSIADVDGNGTDEVIYGSVTINANGTGRYTTSFYAHGDALHVGDFVPNRAGQEIWMIHEQDSGAFLAWRDADPVRELLNGNYVDKYGTGGDTRLFTGTGAHSINGTKSTPSLSGDLFGDWREEIILPRDDNAALRIYSTPIQTDRRIYTLLHDAQYRVAIARQNTAYNQPPHPSFFLGNGMSNPSQPNIYVP